MLSHRVDAPLPGTITRQETFGYDDLDRLTTVRHGLPPGSLAMSMSYAANGNITGKTGLGKYTYDSSKPHAVTEIENTGNLLNPRGQSIEYNALNKAHILIDTVDNDAYRLEITCGPDGQRWKTVLQKNGNITKTVIFAGDYEKITEDGVTRELIYLPGGGIYVRQAGQPDKVYYAHTDHLGSIVSITDGAGAEVFKASYDAWGKQTVTLNTIGFHRGYTGHEHLPEFGLINMNGRMYDPIVGRFLCPDPYVADASYSQDFNRYSYVRNNPLIYTDPDGEWIHIVIGAAVGGIINLGVKAFQGKINSLGDGFAAFGIGAVAGALGAATGGTAFLAAGGGAAGAGGFAAGAVSGMVGSAASTPFLSMGNSIYFGDPMMTGKQYLTGIAAGGLIGGSVNGITALAHGKTFWAGTVKPQPAAFVRPELPPLNSSRAEINIDGMRAEIKGEPMVFENTAISEPMQLEPMQLEPMRGNLVNEVRYVDVKGGTNLLNSANTPSKGGLTEVGRALQKHGSRSGSLFPKVTGNAASINTQGEAALKSIINHPNATIATRYHARFGSILEIKIPNGQGARFSVDGERFIGFIGPNNK